MSKVENKESIAVSADKDYLEGGKNKFIVKCKFCGSKILDKNSGTFITLQEELPLMEQDTRKEGDVQSESITDFYHVENMFTFENIGFTHTVGKYKYLSCADCDAGPVGYHNMETKHSYVAISRIVQGNN